MIYDEFEEDYCPTCAQYTQPDTTTVFDYAVLFEGDPPTESTTIIESDTTTTNIMEDGTTTVDSDISITTTDSDTTVNTEDTTTKTMSTTVDPDTETTTVVETTTTSSVVVETSTKTLLCNTTMSYGVFLAKNVRIFKLYSTKVFSHLLKLFRMNLKRAKNVAVRLLCKISPATNIWSLFKPGI